MRLLNEIISLLSDENTSLNACLVKSQVLAHKLNNAELKSWVISELRGYSQDAELPHYRKLKMSFFGLVTNGYYFYNNTRLPVSHLTDEQCARISSYNVIDSISSIEEWGNKENPSFSVPAELTPLFSDAYSGGYYVQDIEGKIGSQAKDLLNNIRSKLLEYCLELLNEIPEDINLDSKLDEEIQELSREHLNIILNDNAKLVLGNETNSNQSTSIENNITTINQIADIDIKELERAIQADKNNNDYEEKKWGKNVQSWFDRMMNKAGTESWEVSKATAASLLANIITKVSGF